MRNILLTLIFSAITLVTAAQQQGLLGVGFYDVEKLYDTIPSRFYNDNDYTPEGRLRWNSERYRNKIRHTAQVIDSMNLHVIALCGVENEQVVRDIVMECKSDYAFIHRTNDYNKGLDFALLYFADKFTPEKVNRWSNALYVEGWAADSPITIVVQNRSSSIGVLLKERNLLNSDTKIIILGPPNKLNFRKYDLIDATAPAERAGRGNRIYDKGWQMYARIFTNISNISKCDVYARSWLLNAQGEPMATYDRNRYYGGYSNQLPVYIYFDKIFEL